MGSNGMFEKSLLEVIHEKLLFKNNFISTGKGKIRFQYHIECKYKFKVKSESTKQMCCKCFRLRIEVTGLSLIHFLIQKFI